MSVVNMASEEYVDNKVGEKYTLPETGIPARDLSEEVRASLAKADAAATSAALLELGSTKADKSATYTKTEVDAIVQALKTGSRQIVETLPASGQPMVIYMVPKSPSQTNNVYDEYIWTAAGAWEKIGDTEIDLSGYVEKETGKGLSTEDYTADEKAKLAGIAAGANVNVVETVKVNGTALTPDDSKAVNVVVPTGTAANKDTPASGNASETQVVIGSDSRLSDARTPTAHKSSHATGGSDALAPGDINAVAANPPITAGTKCKVTYDSKGLVTAGANLAASDIPQIPTSKLSDFGTKVRYAFVTPTPDPTTRVVTLQDRAVNIVVQEAVTDWTEWYWDTYQGPSEEYGYGLDLNPFYWDSAAGAWKFGAGSPLYGDQTVNIYDYSGQGEDSGYVYATWTKRWTFVSGFFNSITDPSAFIFTLRDENNVERTVSLSGDDISYGYYDLYNGIALLNLQLYDYPEIGSYKPGSGGVGRELLLDSNYATATNITVVNDDGSVVIFKYTAGGIDFFGAFSYYGTDEDGYAANISRYFGGTTVGCPFAEGDRVEAYISVTASRYADNYDSVSSLALPPAVSGVVRDFLVRLEQSQSASSAVGWPTGVTYVTEDGSMPDISAAGTYLLSFTETRPASGNDPAEFAVSAKEITEVSQS